MDINKVIIIGRVGQEPEVRNLPNGGIVCSFSIVTEMFFKKGDERQVKTEWHKIVTFDQSIVTYCQEKVSVGDTLYIEGRLTYRTVESSENTSGKKIKLSEIHVSRYNGTISIFKKKRSEEGDEPTESKPQRKKNNEDEMEDEIPFDI